MNYITPNSETVLVDSSGITNSTGLTLAEVLVDLSDAIDAITVPTAATGISATPDGDLTGTNVQAQLYSLQDQISSIVVGSVTYSTATPLVASSTPSAGSGDAVARANHVHPVQNAGQTSIVAISGVTGTNVQAALENLKTQVDSATGGATPSDTAPAPLATSAAAGTASTYSRSDHVHALPLAASITISGSGGMTTANVQTELDYHYDLLQVHDTYSDRYYRVYGSPTPFTSIPTGLNTIAPKSRVNVLRMNTSGGNIDISSIPTPSTMQIAIGDVLVFRKVSTDANKILWTGDPEGLGGTSVTLELVNPYNVDLAQLSFLCISTSSSPYYLLLNH